MLTASRGQIHSVRPKASVKLAANAKQVSYLNIYLYMSSIIEHKTSTLLTFQLIFFL